MSNTLAAWLMALAAAGLLYLFLRRKKDDDNDGPSAPARRPRIAAAISAC